MESKIKVMLRVKPLSQEDETHEKNQSWSINDNTVSNSETKENWTFDQVFTPQQSTQDIYESQIS